MGVSVSGHSGYADAGEDIVCAAISSAVSMCECAITDVIGAQAQVSVNPKTAEVKINLPKSIAEDKHRECNIVLSALYIHLSALAEEYPQCITISEV